MANRPPIQTIVIDNDGILRFKANEIVRHLLDEGPFDLNLIAAFPFSDEDRQQFAMLIGYSVDGFGELSYASKRLLERVDRKADKLRALRYDSPVKP